MRTSHLSCLAVAITIALVSTPLASQGYTPKECPSCAEWNVPHAPVKVFGNSYYVGTSGLSAMLITSPDGHVLIDGGLPESAPLILKNITALGFRLQDVKLILNSHDHYDHAGGIAELARATGATVAASASSATTLRTGRSGPSDPQFTIILAMPKVPNVRVIAEGDTLRVGPLALVPYATPGHTVGGTTWTWQSCEGARCVQMVYADSQSPISDDGFRFSGDARYPNAAADFARGHSTLERLRCDILITPHPSASNVWERLANPNASPGLIDGDACKRFAAGARAALAARLVRERASERDAQAATTPSVVVPTVSLLTVSLPTALDRVLRDYERAWSAKDASALAALFTTDGAVMQPGRATVRGHRAIAAVYREQGGSALRLRPFAFGIADTVAYILGTYGYGESTEEMGKFTLTLRRGRDKRWLIASDMDNGSVPARKPDV